MASICIFIWWPEADYGLPNSLKMMKTVIIELNYLLTCLPIRQLIGQLKWHHSNKQPINTAEQEWLYYGGRKNYNSSKYTGSVSIAAGYCRGEPEIFGEKRVLSPRCPLQISHVRAGREGEPPSWRLATDRLSHEKSINIVKMWRFLLRKSVVR